MSDERDPEAEQEHADFVRESIQDEIAVRSKEVSSWRVEHSGIAHFHTINADYGTIAHGMWKRDADFAVKAAKMHLTLMRLCSSLLTRLEREGIENIDTKEARAIVTGE